MNTNNHSCTDHLRPREADGISTDGESWRELWWQCVDCGAKYTDDEVAVLMFEAESVAKGAAYVPGEAEDEMERARR